MTDSSQDLLVGLDLGTTSVKAVACTVGGEELAIGRVATPWSRDPDGTTMTADTVAGAAELVLQQCLAQLPGARVIAIGITGMAESGFLVDDTGAVLGPAYAWLDERGAAEAAELADDFAADRFARTTGLPVSVRCSAVKLRWMKRSGHHSGGGRRWESLPEWMAGRLGGRHQAELSLAARTGLLDLGRQDWDDELLSWAGLDKANMAPVAVAGSVWGSVHADHPCVPGATITVAGQDHVCATVGAGVIGETDAFDSLGTGEAVIRATHALTAGDTAKAVSAGLTVGSHVIPGSFILMAGLGTGARLSRVLTALGVTSAADRLVLEQEAANPDAPRSAVEWAVDVVRDGTSSVPPPEEIRDRAAVWRAATEAAGRRLKEALGRLERFSGPHGRLLAAGGWFDSDQFTRTRRTAVGRPITLPKVQEATGRGAAVLAGVAVGVYDSAVTAPLPAFSEV